MPITHADIHRNRVAGRAQTLGKAVCLSLGQLGERRYAIEELVVMRDFLNPLRPHAPPPEDVGEKRADVGLAVRATERDQQDGIKGTNTVSVVVGSTSVIGSANPALTCTPLGSP